MTYRAYPKVPEGRDSTQPGRHCREADKRKTSPSGTTYLRGRFQSSRWDFTSSYHTLPRQCLPGWVQRPSGTSGHDAPDHRQQVLRHAREAKVGGVDTVDVHSAQSSPSAPAMLWKCILRSPASRNCWTVSCKYLEEGEAFPPPHSRQSDRRQNGCGPARGSARQDGSRAGCPQRAGMSRQQRAIHVGHVSQHVEQRGGDLRQAACHRRLPPATAGEAQVDHLDIQAASQDTGIRHARPVPHTRHG